MTVSKNGKPRPIQKFQRLCGKNDKYYSSKAREVKLFVMPFALWMKVRPFLSLIWNVRFEPICVAPSSLAGRVVAREGV
jgi:hypothetical protein